MKDSNNISNNDLHKIFDAKLTDADFQKLSLFIHSQFGIKMPEAKKIMLQSRLQKRLRALGMLSFNDYVEFVFSKKGHSEIIQMMDVVSTNKTDFYREPAHFDFLKSTILPEFTAQKQLNKFKVWSAGCSSGEEAYTAAMLLSDYTLANPQFDYTIYGTDISTQILRKAIDGIYTADRVDIVPLEQKKRYLLKSKNKEKKLIRIVATLRQKTKFERLNFIDKTYPVTEMYDLIFCRNVLIYFDRKTQESVINKLCRNLKKGGYFFLGHSESITGIDVPLKHLQPTIFQKL